MMSGVILNTQQKRAVNHVDGPALVVAGAGTGKTAVITLRIARLILDKNVKPEHILALTFTDKAAQEMQERVDQLLPLGYVDTAIATFHALGDKILREYGIEIGLQSDFVVMTPLQQSIIMKKVIEQLKLKYYKPLSNPFALVSDLLSFLSRLKDENILSADLKAFIGTMPKTTIDEKQEYLRAQELSNIYSLYTQLCTENNMLDYGDQITLVLQLFRARPAILAHYQQQFKYIMVDEYQDTNYAQSQAIKMLSEKHHNIMVVGDDDQAIYAFRGASITNILQFQQQYPKAKTIVLKQNYRSTQTILDAAYRLIQHNNPYRLETEHSINKKLLAQRKGGKVSQLSAANKIDESIQVAEVIKELISKQKLNPRNIAILLRRNRQAHEFAQALQAANVPYLIHESQKLLEQSEIKFLLRFIECLADPLASNALYGLMTSEYFGLHLIDIVPVSSAANAQRKPLEQYMREHNDELPEKMKEILQIFDNYRREASTEGAGQLLYRFIKQTGYLNDLVEQAHTDVVAVQKIQNISQFFQIIREYEQVEKVNQHIFGFWRYISQIYASEIDFALETSQLDTDAVSIMTIHKAKGLEFDAVFIVDMNEQVFPATRRPERIRMPIGLLPTHDQEINWHILEERRLCYVAITRGKQWVYLSSSYDHGGKRLRKPSRFIVETTTKPQAGPILSTNNILQTINMFETLPLKAFNPLAKYVDNQGWLHLSTNQVADYLRSPKEFWYFDVLSLPKGPFHTLVYGSAIHAALEYYYRHRQKQQKIELKKLYEVFENTWRSEGFISLEHEKERFDAGRQVLRNFFTREQKSDDIPKWVERPFILSIDQLKLKISGRYDAVYERNNAIEIRDYKTSDISEEKKAQQRLKDSVQMKIYALAWSQNQPEPLKNISLYFVEHDLLVSSQNFDHEKTLLLLKKAVDGISNLEFHDTGLSQLRFEKVL